MIGAYELGVAAELAALGLPAWRYLTTKDEHERLVLDVLRTRAFKVVTVLQQNQAHFIIRELAKAVR